jgi:tetratricopeptide (TPR) repeat protein
MSALGTEHEMARLVTRAKRDKEEAKDHRDNGEIAAAVSVLEATVKALDDLPLTAGLEIALEPSKPMRDLAAQLADCLGMLGGNYRRQGRLKEAQSVFERGRIYEESPRLEVMSSYNLVNAITLPLEYDAKALETQRPLIEKAVLVLLRQVRGERRSDRWAWADLAQCRLLLGDETGAFQCYDRVRDLGDDDTVASVAAVLERLGNAVPALKSRVVAAIMHLNTRL